MIFRWKITKVKMITKRNTDNKNNRSTINEKKISKKINWGNFAHQKWPNKKKWSMRSKEWN